jgi:predicted SAM-dependent methyltransferase
MLSVIERHAREAYRDIRSEFRQRSAPAKLRGVERLQLGAGNHPLPGWANLDLEGNSIHWDLTRPIPVAAGSIRFVYSEHFIEHVSRADALRILTNCCNVMAVGGIIRLSTPDLKVLAGDYCAGKVVQMPHGDWYPETPCQMLNEALHLWGHQFVYDEPELTGLLTRRGLFQRPPNELARERARRAARISRPGPSSET